MKKFIMLMVIVGGLLVLPHAAAAVEVPLSGLPIEETSLDQSAFDNLPTCELKYPTIAAPPSLTMLIDQPVPPAMNTEAYRGLEQPRAWTGGGFGYKTVWFCDPQVV